MNTGANSTPVPAARRTGSSSQQLIRLLTKRPHANDICRFLALSVDWPQPVGGSVLFYIGDDGLLTIIGYFGYPAELIEAYRQTSLVMELPSTKAVRTRAPVAMYTDADVRREYPELVAAAGDGAGPGGFIFHPLLDDAAPIGVLGIGFKSDIDPEGPTLPMMASFSGLLSLYLALVPESATTPPGQQQPNVDIFDADDDPAEGGLTARQLRVLHLMAKKMTNRDIAIALDYSVSTIKQETTAIYREFGVTGRREAISEARRRGLIRS